jgi:hypothetical protein
VVEGAVLQHDLHDVLDLSKLVRHGDPPRVIRPGLRAYAARMTAM